MTIELARQSGAAGYVDSDHPDTAPHRLENGWPSDSVLDNDGDERRARALGWFSIGLGLAEMVVPGKLAEAIGVENKPGVFRLMGLREIASGVTILRQPSQARGVWSRVVGDVLDLALLSTQLDSDNAERERTLVATVAVLGVAALDLYTGKRLQDRSTGGLTTDAQRRGLRVKEAITVNRPVAEVYAFWHGFQNLPRFMTHLESVQVLGSRRSHWVAPGPAGMRVEWDAEIVEDRPNEVISWRSLPGGHVETSGSVRFKPAPANQGTEIVVEMRYDPPGGAIGATIAKLFGEAPDQMVSRDLRSLKNVLEVGEVVHSDSSIHRAPHPARPLKNETDTGSQRRSLGHPATAGEA